ncbi:hypothetical protein PsYK624_023980 [Phanerochaete sordida]|uniref:Uncharacterized protein n=1 Tax=Phanerochaete sordida TaxID=48140 RepID=A0A9P3G149_9APHY|nr:hypothetical protein PsYK624_023980 [Phanerochaete sordida]
MFRFGAFLLLFLGLQLAQATLFITSPGQGSTCHGGQPCLVEWVDDGEAPFVTTIGACYAGLYNGNGVLVQQIDPVNVAVVRSFQFTPDPAAGPDSHTYYINLTSVNFIGNPAQHYTQYSPFFALDGMSGTFNAPVASDTSSPSVPSSVLSASSNTIISTISVGASSAESSSSSSDPSAVAASVDARSTSRHSASATASATGSSPDISSSTPVATLRSSSSSSSTSTNSSTSSTSSSASGMVTAFTTLTSPSSTAGSSSPATSSSASSAVSASAFSVSSSALTIVALLFGTAVAMLL